MRHLIIFLTLSLATIHAQSFTGQWTGNVSVTNNSTGAPKDEAVAFIFSESEGQVAGTIRVDNGAKRPIRDGKVEANELAFIAGQVAVRLRHSGPRQLTGQGWVGGEAKPSASIQLAYAGEVGPSDISMTERYPPLPFETEARSPRILQLRDAVARKHEGALTGFWEQVTKSGAPLVETGADGSVLATILFRGRPDTVNVMLIRSRFTDAQPLQHLFSRIPSTDVWFKTLRLIPGSRVLYSIAENDPAGTIPRAMLRRTPKVDALNPKQDSGESLLELPGAPPQPWVRRKEGVPALAQSRHRITSRWLKGDREVIVYQPSARPAGPMATIYLFDGQDADGEVFSTATIENLMADGKIPPVVVLRVVHPRGKRDEDLKGSEDFARFMATELVPFARREFGVSADPRDCIVGGKSYGGLAAAFIANGHPEVFGAVLIQSGAFWWEPSGRFGAEPNEIARRFLRSPKLPLRLYMEAGLYEVDAWGGGGNILETSRHLRDILLAKGYDVDYREFAGDHDRINWRGSLADGLISLFNRRGK